MSKAKRQTDGQHKNPEQPGGGEFGKNGGSIAYRLGQKVFNGSLPAFVRPGAHGNGRYQHRQDFRLIEKKDASDVLSSVK